MPADLPQDSLVTADFSLVFRMAVLCILAGLISTAALLYCLIKIVQSFNVGRY